jgi:tRNA 2-thiouridine synthesizing protein A
MADVALNCEKLNCPMPIVRISQTIKTMLDAQTLEVTAYDPAFSADVQAWVTRMGHELVSLEGDTLQRAIIRKRPGKRDSQ